MSNDYEAAQFSQVHERETEPREFQEAPGEAEAESARDAILKGAGAQPANVASALANADQTLRTNALSRLQQECGNSYVQRVVAEAKGTAGRLVGASQPEMVDEVLQRKGAGQPLPEGARNPMEAHFGADLSGVRVHSDGEASSLNRELDAQAFTVGSDIFFDQGKFDPSSSEGQGLLAHELTHVGQQGGFGAQAVQREAVADEEDAMKQAGKKPEEESAV